LTPPEGKKRSSDSSNIGLSFTQLGLNLVKISKRQPGLSK
jgi:hypothetical protein